MSCQTGEEREKCSYRECGCIVEGVGQFCSEKCRRSDRSERHVDGCRCEHDDCEAEETDEDDDLE
jgi:hypothetical protein